MQFQKLCLGTCGDYRIPEKEQIKLIAQAGFDGFFTGWSSGADIKGNAALAKELGITYQSIHAPFNKTDDIWLADETTARIGIDEIKHCLSDCAANGIPIMVSHVMIGFDHTESPTEEGLRRYGEIIAEAEKLGVKIGFENTEGDEFLKAILTEFASSESVGFCWDSGHEMCYNHSSDLLAMYGSKLICTHLNDNLGVSSSDGSIGFTDDLHLLPFDGIADWDYNARRLDQCGYCGYMTFELKTASKQGRHENDIYSSMPLEMYLSEAYKRAVRVAAKRKIKCIGV